MPRTTANIDLLCLTVQSANIYISQDSERIGWEKSEILHPPKKLADFNKSEMKSIYSGIKHYLKKVLQISKYLCSTQMLSGFQVKSTHTNLCLNEASFDHLEQKWSLLATLVHQAKII